MSEVGSDADLTNIARNGPALNLLDKLARAAPNSFNSSARTHLMTFTAFFCAVLALLIAPGPTNTLMSLAGAQSGLRGAAHLLPAEVFGYVTTIIPLTYLGAELLAQHPAVAAALNLAAAAWIMFLALTLWRRRDNANASSDVTARRVYLTTALNPKALIFGLILLPAPAAPQFVLKMGTFILMVIAVALTWATAGTLMRIGDDGDSKRLQAIQRVASAWLAVVSITLFVNAIRA